MSVSPVIQSQPPREQYLLAKKMLQQHFPIHSIMRVTHLNEAVIHQLQQDIEEAIRQEFRSAQVQGSQATQTIRAEIMAIVQRSQSPWVEPETGGSSRSEEALPIAS